MQENADRIHPPRSCQFGQALPLGEDGVAGASVLLQDRGPVSPRSSAARANGWGMGCGCSEQSNAVHSPSSLALWDGIPAPFLPLLI